MSHQNLVDEISDHRASVIARYREFFVGKPGVWPLLVYEFGAWLARNMPGALGYWSRNRLYAHQCGEVGPGVQWGQSISLRHAYKMRIGANSVFDDHCMLDARGAADGDFVIGQSVLVARSTILQTKSGFIRIGDHCTIGALCYIGSFGGISIGDHVGIAGHCYMGGARYETHRVDVPMKNQTKFSEGPIEIGEGCWIGAGVTILDGASIGAGSIIGAGAVIRADVPEMTIAMPQQKMIPMKRRTEDPNQESPST